MGRHVAILLAALLCLFAWSNPVAAQGDADIAEARAQFKKGKIHYKLGRFEEALTSFSAAYAAKQLPAFLLNIGQCHMQLKNLRTGGVFLSGVSPGQRGCPKPKRRRGSHRQGAETPRPTREGESRQG